ncbi:MAG TPA: hypothetical protein VLH56_07420 [Dissulfurispiraceae bacterium]|nr:hypothetical protein [Dissulfurispiraceae bacterium]
MSDGVEIVNLKNRACAAKDRCRRLSAAVDAMKQALEAERNKYIMAERLYAEKGNRNLEIEKERRMNQKVEISNLLDVIKAMNEKDVRLQQAVKALKAALAAEQEKFARAERLHQADTAVMIQKHKAQIDLQINGAVVEASATVLSQSKEITRLRGRVRELEGENERLNKELAAAKMGVKLEGGQ